MSERGNMAMSALHVHDLRNLEVRRYHSIEEALKSLTSMLQRSDHY
jgi:hypothetical protein